MPSESISIECPECGTANHLTSDELVKNLEVNCSHCKATLGYWRDLVHNEQSPIAGSADNTGSDQDVKAG